MYLHEETSNALLPLQMKSQRLVYLLITLLFKSIHSTINLSFLWKYKARSLSNNPTFPTCLVYAIVRYLCQASNPSPPHIQFKSHDQETCANTNRNEKLTFFKTILKEFINHSSRWYLMMKKKSREQMVNFVQNGVVKLNKSARVKPVRSSLYRQLEIWRGREKKSV